MNVSKVVKVIERGIGMDKLVYIYYVLLAVVLFWGAKVYGRKTWNDGFMSISQTKALQGFSAFCIMFHHIGQKTCASWLNPRYIVHGLDVFVPIGYYFVGIFLLCSGYGLYKSYKEKPNYLKGFFGRRILPVILAYYSTGIIFLIVRLLMGQKMNVKQFFIYLTGLQLSNPNTWFVIALPIMYFGFYLAFKFCKNENVALFLTCLIVFLYTLLGTFIDHNNWWMRGEWWYNSVHFFSMGLLFARFEKSIINKVKKHYVLYLALAFISIFVLYFFSEYTQNVFSYYGENFHADFKVLRRWVCLLSQIAASCSFVFFVFMLGLKIKIGNKVLAFMGTITLEFYLIHGLFVELFGFNFIDVVPSLYYIKNVFLMVIVVFVPSVPAALLLQKLHKWLVRVLTTKKEKPTIETKKVG